MAIVTSDLEADHVVKIARVTFNDLEFDFINIRILVPGQRSVHNVEKNED